MLGGAVAVVLRKDARAGCIKLTIKFKHTFVSPWKVTSEVCVLFLENKRTRCVAVAIAWIYREETTWLVSRCCATHGAQHLPGQLPSELCGTAW